MAYITPKDDGPQLFDANWLTAEIDEARARVKELAAPHPGCWNWCKEHRPDLYDRLDFYRRAYKESFDGEVGAACCKWMFMVEVAAKKIIMEYVRVSHQKANNNCS